jgi:hypothetical protein
VVYLTTGKFDGSKVVQVANMLGLFSDGKLTVFNQC